jgi:hypothetical protein
MQQGIHEWTIHHPFIQGIPSCSAQETKVVGPHAPQNFYTKHLSPHGTPIPPVDPTSNLWVCMQNTKFAFQLCDDGINLSYNTEHLTNLGVHLFALHQPENQQGKPFKLDPHQTHIFEDLAPTPFIWNIEPNWK